MRVWITKPCRLANVFVHWSQLKRIFAWLCDRLCSHKPWRLVKFLPHSLQTYGLASECLLRRCSSSSLCIPKLVAHTSHENAFLRWIHMWRCIFCLVPKVLGQWSHWCLCGFTFVGVVAVDILVGFNLSQPLWLRFIVWGIFMHFTKCATSRRCELNCRPQFRHFNFGSGLFIGISDVLASCFREWETSALALLKFKWQYWQVYGLDADWLPSAGPEEFALHTFPLAMCLRNALLLSNLTLQWLHLYKQKRYKKCYLCEASLTKLTSWTLNCQISEQCNSLQIHCESAGGMTNRLAT